jgi:hypothetical protein
VASASVVAVVVLVRVAVASVAVVLVAVAAVAVVLVAASEVRADSNQVNKTTIKKGKRTHQSFTFFVVIVASLLALLLTSLSPLLPFGRRYCHPP